LPITQAYNVLFHLPFARFNDGDSPFRALQARHETEDPKYRDPNEGTLSHWFAQAQSTLAGITSPQK
jgi:hypothetical protein